MANSTELGGLFGSSLVYFGETPVPTWLPSLSLMTMLHWIVPEPNGAVTVRSSGSEPMRAQTFLFSERESRAVPPSSKGESSQVVAVAGQPDATASCEILTLAW